MILKLMKKQVKLGQKKHNACWNSDFLCAEMLKMDTYVVMTLHIKLANIQDLSNRLKQNLEAIIILAEMKSLPS